MADLEHVGICFKGDNSNILVLNFKSGKFKGVKMQKNVSSQKCIANEVPMPKGDKQDFCERLMGWGWGWGGGGDKSFTDYDKPDRIDHLKFFSNKN